MADVLEQEINNYLHFYDLPPACTFVFWDVELGLQLITAHQCVWNTEGELIKAWTN